MAALVHAKTETTPPLRSHVQFPFPSNSPPPLFADKSEVPQTATTPKHDTFRKRRTLSAGNATWMDSEGRAEPGSTPGRTPMHTGTDPTPANVDAQMASREQVTVGAVGGPAPVAESGPPSAQPNVSQPSQETPSDVLPATGTKAPESGHELPAIRVPNIVAPSSYLRFKTSHSGAMAAAAEPPQTQTHMSLSSLDSEQQQGLVRQFFLIALCA